MHRHDPATHLGKEMSSLKITAANNGHKRGSDIIKATAFRNSSRGGEHYLQNDGIPRPQFWTKMDGLERERRPELSAARLTFREKFGKVPLHQSLPWLQTHAWKISTNIRFFFPSAMTAWRRRVQPRLGKHSVTFFLFSITLV